VHVHKWGQYFAILLYIRLAIFFYQTCCKNLEFSGQPDKFLDLNYSCKTYFARSQLNATSGLDIIELLLSHTILWITCLVPMLYKYWGSKVQLKPEFIYFRSVHLSVSMSLVFHWLNTEYQRRGTRVATLCWVEASLGAIVCSSCNSRLSFVCKI
jgi:hypothetical protein